MHLAFTLSLLACLKQYQPVYQSAAVPQWCLNGVSGSAGRIFFFFFVSLHFYFSEFGSFTCAEFWHLRSKTIDFRICGYGHHATQLFIATYIRVVVVSFEHVLGASHLVGRRVVLVAVYYNTNKISFYFYFIHFRLLCAQVFFVSSKS